MLEPQVLPPRDRLRDQAAAAGPGAPRGRRGVLAAAREDAGRRAGAGPDADVAGARCAGAGEADDLIEPEPRVALRSIAGPCPPAWIITRLRWSSPHSSRFSRCARERTPDRRATEPPEDVDGAVQRGDQVWASILRSALGCRAGPREAASRGDAGGRWARGEARAKPRPTAGAASRYRISTMLTAPPRGG